MTTLFNITPYLASLQDHDTFITANSRISDAMRNAYAKVVRAKRDADSTSDAVIIESPKIVSLNQWLTQTWNRFQANHDPLEVSVCLSKMQRVQLWQSIIANNIDAMPMAKPEHLSNQADSAYRSLVLWQISQSQLALYGSQANQYPFLAWFQQFNETLEKNAWTTGEKQQEVLKDAFNNGVLEKTQHIHLIGFDDIPPLTLSLFHHAAEQVTNHIPEGTPENVQESTQEKHVKRFEFQSRKEEIIAAANWAKQQLLNNPDTTLGIISPNLGQTRDLIETVFCQVFEPHYRNVTRARYALPFNFSAGTPLSSTPLIHDTLSLLKLNSGTLTVDNCINLLNSPFWAGGYAQEESTLAIKRLSNVEKVELNFADFRHALADESQLKQRLIEFDQYFRRLPKRLRYRDWVKHCVGALDIIGWPGQRRLDSMEYQQVVQWQNLLTSLVNLDLFSETKTVFQFISELSRSASTTPFQAQTRGTPIQILGALEAAGLQFDATWVLSLDDQTWPAPPSPNPLLPIDLQRQHNFPNATAERELNYANSLTQRYISSARNVNISSAKWHEDCELSPSGLITKIPLSRLTLNALANTHEEKAKKENHVQQAAFDFEEQELLSTDDSSQPLTTKTLIDFYNEQQFKRSHKTWIDCVFAPAVEDPSQQKGGTSLLQWQAQQPFNAFARYRLKLQTIEPASRHIKPTTRGQITHDVLSLFWDDVKTKDKLSELSEQQRREQIESRVNRTIRYIGQNTEGDVFSPEIQKIEARRQVNLIDHWLAYELERGDFNVEATEFKLSASFNGLNFSVRVDRLDKIGDKTLVIDYKSGAISSTKQWLDERPQQPQLPLYLMMVDPQPEGISFAFVSTKNTEFRGIGNFNAAIKGIASADGEKLPHWDVLVEKWRENLGVLCSEFIEGVYVNHFYHASAAPFQEAYLPFNRINEKHQLYTLWSHNPNTITFDDLHTRNHADDASELSNRPVEPLNDGE